MKNNFTITSRIASLAMLLFFSMNLFAQPANDNCADATPLVLAVDAASCIQVDGDTRMTVDATTVTGTPAVCSGSWYTDDVWFSVPVGAVVPVNGFTIQVEFGSQADDVPNVGMGVYGSCDESEVALACFSDAPGRTTIEILPACLSPNQDYIVRVWSAGSPTDNAGTFRICAYESVAPPVNTNTVFWGDQPMEGDFDGGLNDWITTSDAPCDTLDLWQWASSGSTLDASVANSFGDATSAAPTGCTGAMVFNSDGFDQTGTCGATQIGELISPVLDLSTIVPAGTAGVSVLFYQTTRQFQSTYIVSYTNDGGSNWNDIVINDEFIVNSTTFQTWKRVFLPGADLTSTNFQFKFRYEGNYYFWIIDDVQLIETEAHNLQADPFFAIAPNLLTPASQTDSIRFLIDVANVGATPQENVNVNMNIVNSAGAEVYNEDLPYGTIAADFVDENRIFPGHFLPGAVIDTYTGTYTVSADSTDFDISNNSQSFSFQITDSIFAKEEATGLFASSPQTPPELTWTIATSYFVRNGESPIDPNIKYECSSVLFSLQDVADDAGGFVTLYLYEWEDVNNDGISQNTERNGTTAGKVLGNFTYVIDGTETDVIVALENWDDPGMPIQLEANTNYVLAAGLTPGGTTKIEFSSTNDNDLFATEFLTDSVGVGRIGGMWNTTIDDGGLNSDLTLLGSAPRLRMHVNPYLEVSVNSPLDEANKVNVYPNPATEVVNMELELVEDLNNAIVRIVDLNARNVMEVTYDKLTNKTLTYSVANLSAGTYFLKIQSDKGYITKKFTIVK